MLNLLYNNFRKRQVFGMNILTRKIKFIAMNIASSVFFSNKLRIKIYKMCGMDIGKRVFIYTNCFFNGSNIKIGDGTFINYNCVFENNRNIEIGDNCFIGMEVLFCAVTHEIGPEEARAGKTLGLPIKVENGCWIGSRTTILQGVTIGNGCVIGAGSLVNKDCKPNGLYVGVPARRIKDLPLEGVKKEVDSKQQSFLI
jgi:maltose O-acetyltransferase